MYGSIYNTIIICLSVFDKRSGGEDSTYLTTGMCVYLEGLSLNVHVNSNEAKWTMSTSIDVRKKFALFLALFTVYCRRYCFPQIKKRVLHTIHMFHNVPPKYIAPGLRDGYATRTASLIVLTFVDVN